MRGHRSRRSFMALALLIGAAWVSPSGHPATAGPEPRGTGYFRDLVDLAPALPAEWVVSQPTIGSRRTAERGDGGPRIGLLGRDGPARMEASEDARRPTDRAHRSGSSGARLLGLAASPANAPPHRT